MRARTLWSILPVLFGCANADGEPRKEPSAPASAGPVVIELFTSQGCSSCPPADRILGKLAKAGSLGSTPVAALTFHVDYWDDLGWPDPFASPAWSERQRQYAHALREDRVYTPELVVGGAAGMVGSNLIAITRAIGQAPRPALLPAKAVWTAGQLEVTTQAPPGADVLVAVWEGSTTTRVPRGENAGEQLSSAHVVRRLERVAVAGHTGTLRVPLDPSWHEVGAIVFAQRPDQVILASAWLPR